MNRLSKAGATRNAGNKWSREPNTSLLIMNQCKCHLLMIVMDWPSTVAVVLAQVLTVVVLMLVLLALALHSQEREHL